MPQLPKTAWMVTWKSVPMEENIFANEVNQAFEIHEENSNSKASYYLIVLTHWGGIIRN